MGAGATNCGTATGPQAGETPTDNQDTRAASPCHDQTPAERAKQIRREIEAAAKVKLHELESATPAELEKLLRDEHLPDVVGEKPVKKARKRLSRFVSTVFGHPQPFLGGMIGGVCCSHRWALDCAEAGWNWRAVYPVPPLTWTTPRPVGEGGGVRERPVWGDRVFCPRCGQSCGATYITSSGHCQDCRYETMKPEEVRKIPKSASVIDFHKLRVTKGRVFND